MALDISISGVWSLDAHFESAAAVETCAAEAPAAGRHRAARRADPHHDARARYPVLGELRQQAI